MQYMVKELHRWKKVLKKPSKNTPDTAYSPYGSHTVPARFILLLCNNIINIFFQASSEGSSPAPRHPPPHILVASAFHTFTDCPLRETLEKSEKICKKFTFCSTFSHFLPLMPAKSPQKHTIALVLFIKETCIIIIQDK